MNNSIVRKFYFATAAFVTASVVLLTGCGWSDTGHPPPAVEQQDSDIPDEVINGFEMTLTDNGIRKGLARAVRAEKYGKQQLFRATDLTVLFYTDAGRVKSVLTSRKGIVHMDTGNMEAMDSVVVLSADSTRTLHTESLVWLKEDNVIRGDSAVVVRGPRGEVTGGTGSR